MSMNKPQFLSHLNTLYSAVGTFQQAFKTQIDFDHRKAELGYGFYYVLVDQQMDVDGNTISKMGKVFCKIFDEGDQSENVIWEEVPEPKFLRELPDNTFLDQVTAWYETNKDPKIVKFEIIELNKDLEFAIARVFEVSADTATEKYKFLYKINSTVSVVDLVKYGQ